MCIGGSGNLLIPTPAPTPAAPPAAPIELIKNVEAAPTLKKKLLTEGTGSTLSKLRIPLNVN
jgi:hypothetical protein